MIDLAKPIKITILYDNRSFSHDLTSDWGFSCLIQGMSKTILFDTGASGKILLSNMSKLEIDPKKIETVLISHDHKDHSGGLTALLDINPNIEVWLPAFFTRKFKDSLRSKGAEVLDVNGSKKICEGVWTTGIVSGWIKEQSLILESPKGLILITGCAHPRIVKIIDHVRSMLDKPIYLVMGGFHLAGFEKAEIQAIIRSFRQIGIQQVGPAHCSGVLAHTLFKDVYDLDYLDIGTGQEIIIA